MTPFLLVCFLCRGRIEPHKPVVYLHTGVVVHVRCRLPSRVAVGNTVAIVQPSAAAMRRHIRETHAAVNATAGDAIQAGH